MVRPIVRVQLPKGNESPQRNKIVGSMHYKGGASVHHYGVCKIWVFEVFHLHLFISKAYKQGLILYIYIYILVLNLIVFDL